MIKNSQKKCWGFIVGLMPFTQFCCQESANHSEPSASSQDLDNLVHEGVLEPGQSREFSFSSISKGTKIKLELKKGFELTKKYQGDPLSTVWISDLDSGKRLFGTLYSASYTFPDDREVFRVMVENVTQDQVDFSLGIKAAN